MSSFASSEVESVVSNASLTPVPLGSNTWLNVFQETGIFSLLFIAQSMS